MTFYIRKWAIKYNINQNLEKLLNILCRNSYQTCQNIQKHSYLPTNTSYNIRVMYGINRTEFVYFGIKKWLDQYFVSNLHISSDYYNLMLSE